jgi:hypothetical protein
MNIAYQRKEINLLNLLYFLFFKEKFQCFQPFLVEF